MVLPVWLASEGRYCSLTNTTQSYGVNGLNQYSAVAGISMSWDPRGNLTSDGSTTYSYDLENHLAAASGTHDASLEYDGGGNLLRRYAYGADGDDPLVWYEGAAVGQSNRRYLHSDHEGSIIAVTDGNGSTIAVNRYDPYGVRGASNQGRFQYTGQAYLPELGLYYYKARMYNATLGRFMQTDPVGYEDDLDLYTYVGNDPLDKTDPSGELCIGAGECIDPAPPPTPSNEAHSTTLPMPSPPAIRIPSAPVIPEVIVIGVRYARVVMVPIIALAAVINIGLEEHRSR